MLVILKGERSPQKLYFRTCQQLAAMDSEWVATCFQEPELYHRMLTKNLNYFLFRDYLCLLHLKLKLPHKCSKMHALSRLCHISRANSDLSYQTVSCFCKHLLWNMPEKQHQKSWKLPHKRWPITPNCCLKHSYTLVLISTLCTNVLQLLPERGFQRQARKMSCLSTMKTKLTFSSLMLHNVLL